ncbi:MAG: DUF4383 domain-containing protein [Bacteroidota bacterium]
MNTKSASIIIGIIFLAIGLLGFIPNPIVGNNHNAIFHADTIHNSVHIISGILFLYFAFATRHASTFCKVFGVVYFLLGVLGLFNLGTDGMGTLLGFLHVNGADNFLHIALGIVIFLAGSLKRTTTLTVV